MEETKNDYESKKREREYAREEESKRVRMAKAKKSLLRYALWLIIVAIIGYGIFLLAQTAVPEGEDFSVAYDIQGRDHIADGEKRSVYNSNPPSSGPHYGSTVRGGFYDEPLPDEQVIHNLEHGDIWIAYHPHISDKAKEKLKSFAGRYVVVSPRLENEGDISLVAWGRVDTFDINNEIVDEGRIRDFIRRYDNRGPEKVRGR
ncbi:MAG: hypothetical protein A3G52_03025 [Candidatus Taylorbacteria bacterium RIFCSPLOWO2_12_FULL_43_20]|uniref:DUF3105 domain-containing protein n=1 Tax=Candidatus Taylorbacteria bacterium RIFCSPLOWO2_12_FULL_43_20 TaxID=1802332 RepID=A0A1G2P338_9BACT|nr:MAG: hypothetical protein A2825_03820 [Candidatus Taylorbacteria bacterium RIFCSPHIGHO2_01_FULL_43_120]OHA22073.1 MAG: hypothetical protein A3B98_04205 [Candidatus Taylorbacteria bacterium RIFCSPHIGHO2_02_FULL_43_55]OHA28182.1 MAG: hypothetical protein A3E92_02165 [Candidatus Taylorbacteria bacterium RIFCSPHIGHO2_12_FULL_42_34]OHA31046.1 MAG: hypothetical protein A3B09_04150 [Candidatus Taylorbacteria bacterium RIFCSPLOWO2_01_FULL_43_83]OHA39718.1 MAG: hypothetical protein A3H58_04650 [Candi